MNVILLSGGSGKRLWPLSNDIRSKQFIRMLTNEKGETESMLTRVYRQITTVDVDADITIATSKRQVSVIKNQLGDKVDVCVEPQRRDTFPAICLACAYLHDKKGIKDDESVVVCPVDSFVQDSFFQDLRTLAKMAEEGEANLSLLGIEPVYPSEKYGYIIPMSRDKVSKVAAFKEKPDVATAESYMAQGALWSGGIFAFRLGYLLNKAHERIQFKDYDDLLEQYGDLEKISIDYAVVEREKELQVLRYQGEWKDLGTWNTFSEAMATETLGNVVLNDTCCNTHVVNELNIPLLCMGCRDMVIAASSDGILVSDKEQSSYIKSYVEHMEQQIMYAEKSWGSFTVLDVQEESLTIRIVLRPGEGLHYHSHDLRDEVWTVVSGSGWAVVDGVKRDVAPGDVISLPAGCKHMIFAESELKVIEIQMGEGISVEDKRKYEMNML